MKYVSLFSGIEAVSVAWKALGWECVAVSEIDKFPCEVLKTRYPNVPNLGSVTDITEERLNELKKEHGAIDLVVGGSPCQSFSVAGKRLGLEDARGNLMFEYCRIVGALRPKWFVWENVPGALSSNQGQDFNCLLEEMAQFGYVLGWRVLDAQYFGVPQRRRRVFLVGCLGDDTGPFKVLFEREGSDWDLAQSGKEGEDDSTQIEDSVGEYGEQREQPIIYTANAIRTGSSIEHTVCPTLRATHSKMGDNFPSIVVEYDVDSQVVTPLYARSGSSPSSDDFAPELQPKMVIEKTWVYHSNHSQRTPTEHDKCPTLLAWMGTGGNNIPMIVDQGYYENHPQDSRVKGPCEVAKSVTATYGTGGGNIPFIVEQTLHESRKQRCGYDEKTVCPTLESAMGVGGGNIPLIVQQSTIFKERDFGEYRECTVGANLRASGGTLGGGSESLVVQYDLDKEKTGTLCARDAKGIGQDECVQQKIIVENHHTIQHDMDFDLGGTLCARDHKGISSDDFPVNAQKLVLERHIPISIQGNLIGRNENAGPAGVGYNGNGVMYTLTGTDVHAVQVDEVTPIRVESKVRRLTPIECERLQGFPDNWTQIEWRGKKAEDCPLSPRYKALGNSMAVPVMQWLGLGIMYAEGMDKPTSGLFKVMRR